MVNLEEFLNLAGDRTPCVGIHVATPLSLAPPPSVEFRTVDGAHTKTVLDLFDAFAQVWQFPPWFGRNTNAFNDFMRDLDNMVNTATGKTDVPGYLTEITHAHLLLVDQPEAFSWFAEKMPFYSDYYRDEATPPASFGLVLSVTADQLAGVRERWLATGIQIATVAD